MKYIWQHKQWPHFTYDLSKIQDILYKYAIVTGYLSEDLHHLPDALKTDATIDLMVAEAVKTSEIEGEKLDSDDVRSSIRNQLGLNKDSSKIKDPRAIGIAQLMVSVRKNYAQQLTKEELFSWHTMLFHTISPAKNIKIGHWRIGQEPMQIISGPIGREKVHYEAPPSPMVDAYMEQFINWFNATNPIRAKDAYISGPVRAAIAHLYFECIHPFDDGNGRIGRALVEKTLSQELKRPIFFSISTVIEEHKKEYYQQLTQASEASLDITSWIEYFVQTIYGALLQSQEQVLEIVRKAQFWNMFGDRLNERQSKVIAKMLKQGLHGFIGGITASKYSAIAKCSEDIAIKDLNELVKLGCLEQLSKNDQSKSYQIKLVSEY